MQTRNAPLPIATLIRPEQPVNALFSILATLLGIVTLTNAEQLLNTYPLISVTPSGTTRSDSNSSFKYKLCA